MERNRVRANPMKAVVAVLMVAVVVTVFAFYWYDCLTASCPGPPGSLLVFKRKTYKHYAVVVYCGYIIHATSVTDSSVGSSDVSGYFSVRSEIAEIRKQKYGDFVQPGDEVEVENGYWNGNPPLPVWEIIERAHSKIGKRDYSVMWSNCEHFARWCRYGEKASDQANRMKAGLLLAVVAVCCWFARNLFNLSRLRWLVPHFPL